MKAKGIMYFIIMAAFFMTACGDDPKIDISNGSGNIIYEGASYSLNLTTSYISKETDGRYKHDLAITNTERPNDIFSFTIRDEETIRPGEYAITLNGDNAAHFRLSTGAADSLVGTMKVDINGDKYEFYFKGTTVDENSEIKEVIFSYSGKI
jgi:hypothetical protein